jgi:hypothetical protein
MVVEVGMGEDESHPHRTTQRQWMPQRVWRRVSHTRPPNNHNDNNDVRTLTFFTSLQHPKSSALVPK